MRNSEQPHISLRHTACTKTLFCTWLSGSFTVEAALVLPLFVFCLALFLGLFRVLSVELQMEQAISYVSGRLAVYAADKDPDEELSLEGMSAVQLLRRQLKRENCEKGNFAGGYNGIWISLRQSDHKFVRCDVTYEIKLPVPFFGKKTIVVHQNGSARRFSGWIPAQDVDDIWVYITKTGTAYHKTTACRYLDLTVHEVSVKNVGQLRNKDGSIYRKCNSCADKTGNGSVYITDYGAQYHGSVACRKLKRTVYRVSIKDVKGKKACAKCYGS